MPPKRKAAPKKKQETPPPSESEPESEPEYSSEEEPESPKPKKTKPGPKPKAAAAAAKAKVAPTPTPKTGKAAAPKKQTAKRGAKAEVAAEPSPLPQKTVPKAVPKEVIIEHCKQCSSFKKTATKLEALLKTSVPDLKVTLNPEKPRKGIFEVRDSENNIFISLQGLTRPFKKMKDLNLEETAKDVASKLT